jgi:hypothetical protein
MAVSPASVQVGKSYLFQPGNNIRRVVAITPDGNVQYVSRSGTDSGGSATSCNKISLDRFARDAVCEVQG